MFISPGVQRNKMAMCSLSQLVVALSFFISSTRMCDAFSIREASVSDFQIAFKKNLITSQELVKFYLVEIRELNPNLKGIIEVNPDALFEAEKADKERQNNSCVQLPYLHGIPVILKDLIATKDKLNTTAGSFALLGSVVPRDAAVVLKLRQAGAIILGKASLSEWAHFRSFTAPNGWSSRGGQGKVRYKTLHLMFELHAIVC